MQMRRSRSLTLPNVDGGRASPFEGRRVKARTTISPFERAGQQQRSSRFHNERSPSKIMPSKLFFEVLSILLREAGVPPNCQRVLSSMWAYLVKLSAKFLWCSKVFHTVPAWMSSCARRAPAPQVEGGRPEQRSIAAPALTQSISKSGPRSSP